VESNPTKRMYNNLNTAYDFFNERLFEGKLPHCLITMQRRNKAYGYFSGDRFGTFDGSETTDEIALNPALFKDRTAKDILSVLVHEMVHLRQHHQGNRSRQGYHNSEWADMMDAIGLTPSSTGEPGGKRTGQRVNHYIVHGGAFDLACNDLLERGVHIAYLDIWDSDERRKKAAPKTKYTCPGCGLSVWGKPDIEVLCGACKALLLPPQPDQATTIDSQIKFRGSVYCSAVAM
jgi:predicted SprT family Zn-dependent metalloprotease